MGRGPAPPLQWMETWRDHHPDWNYRLIDNDYLARTSFCNHSLIDEYMRRMDFHGATDLIRYEVLLKYGGFIPEADSICLMNTDVLWDRNCAYTVFENEEIRTGLVSPILAAEPNNSFVAVLVQVLASLKPHELGSPWKTVGNKFVSQMIERSRPENLIVFPSHYFIPTHFVGKSYSGTGPIYAKQMWGTTNDSYQKPFGPIQNFRRTLRKKVWTKLHINSVRRGLLKLRSP